MVKTLAKLRAEQAALAAEMAAAEAAEAEANKPVEFADQSIDQKIESLHAKVGEFTTEEVGKLREILSRFFPPTR